MAENNSRNIVSDGAIILFALLIASISVFLIVFSGIMYYRWLNKEVPAYSKRESSINIDSGLLPDTENTGHSVEKGIQSQETNNRFILSNDEFVSFTGDDINIGQTIQTYAWIENNREEIIEKNELQLTWGSDDPEDYDFNAASFVGTVPQGVEIHALDYVLYTGKYMGKKEYEEESLTDWLTGNSPDIVERPYFETVDIEIIKSSSFWGDSNEAKGIEKYENIAIKTAEEYSEFENNPDYDGVSAVFKVQFISYADNTKWSMFHIDGRDSGISGYGEITEPFEMGDWLYVIATYTNNMPPYYAGVKGLVIEEVIKIQ